MDDTVRVYIYDKSLRVKNIVVFIGHVDDRTVKILTSYSEKPSLTKSSSDHLKKIFGREYKRILCLDQPKVGGSDEDSTKLDEDSSKLDDFDDIFQMDEIDILLNESNLDASSADNVVSLSKTSKKTDNGTLSSNVSSSSKKMKFITFVFNIRVYMHDNVVTFKKKISAATGIPIHKQYLTYKASDGTHHNLKYYIFLNNIGVNISLFDKLDTSNNINGIPIFIDFYDKKKQLVVKSYDASTTLQNMLEQSSNTYHLVSLDEYDINLVEKNEVDIVYYGFVVLFWPIFTDSVWHDYMYQRDEFDAIYIDFSNGKQDTKMYEKEQLITNEMYDATVNKNVYASILSTTISVSTPTNRQIVNLRNLFDLMKLSDKVPSCRCSLIHNNRRIIFNKTFKDFRGSKSAMPLTCVILKIRSADALISMTIFKDGNYQLVTDWPEKDSMSFADVIKLSMDSVNSVVDYINSLGTFVVANNYSLERMSSKNSKFNSIKMSFTYRQESKLREFKIIEKILDDYEEAGMIISKTKDPLTNVNEYYIVSGMHMYNLSMLEKNYSLTNTYSYMSNSVIKEKWLQLFGYAKSMTLSYNYGTIRWVINGAREEEYDIIYGFIMHMVHKLTTTKVNLSSTIHDMANRSLNNVKQLKTIDPVLYDFKKVYNSPIVYSKICQRPNQPRIISKDEYKKLTNKESAINYYNFTTHQDAIYHCPSKKYPYPHFLVNRHPNNYCMIHCLKTPYSPETANEVNKEIYTSCISKHIYNKSKENLIQNSRYVLQYGKDIQPGRLSNLPPETIESLLYESFSKYYKGLDDSCSSNEQYLVVGIEQVVNGQHAGVLVALANALDKTVNEILLDVSEAIIKQQSKFTMIIEGSITKFFNTPVDLVNGIHAHFINSGINDEEYPWNKIFIDIAYLYLDVIVAIFIDNSRPDKENVTLYASNALLNLNQISSTNRVLLLLKRKKSYFPVYWLNPLTFFRTRVVSKKLFGIDDDVIRILTRLIAYNEKRSNASIVMSLSTLNKFILDRPEYTIQTHYINNDNTCYYVHLKGPKGQDIYAPVHYSPQLAGQAVNEPCRKTSDYVVLMAFVADINKWSETPLIVPENWILLNNPYDKSKASAVIGFTADGLNYYFNDITYERAKKLSDSIQQEIDMKFIQVMYRPNDVNAQLGREPVYKPSSKDMYDYHVYKLFLLEMITAMQQGHNDKLRDAIVTTIKKDTYMDTAPALIRAYYKSIENYVPAHLDEDIQRMRTSISEYMFGHNDKKRFITEFTLGYYNFDRELINKIRFFPKKELVKELENIANKVVTIKTDAEISKLLAGEPFFNMISSCTVNNVYCHKKRLMITKKKLQELIPLLADDIQNPYKEAWILNPMFIESTLEYFKFIKRKDEFISVEVF
jgi:hypothetical protein